MGEPQAPTSMHLLNEAKSRFDSLKRQIEAEEDQNLRNSEVLHRLIDNYEANQGENQ